MSDARALSSPRILGLLVRGVWVELVRRRDFYVLLLMMGLFVAGVMAVRVVGIHNASTATFLLNLGMTLASVPAHILTILVAARLLPDEMENRTIYPLLARPIHREQLVLGKWLAAAATGTGVFLVLAAMAWLPVPKMEFYSAPLLAQAVVLQAGSLAALAAFTIALSLLVPRALAVAIAAGIVFLGGKAEALFLNSIEGAPGSGVASWAARYVPEFAKFDLVTRYTDGIGPLSPSEFTGLIVYAAVLTAFFLGVAMLRFRRRVL